MINLTEIVETFILKIHVEMVISCSLRNDVFIAHDMDFHIT